MDVLERKVLVHPATDVTVTLLPQRFQVLFDCKDYGFISRAKLLGRKTDSKKNLPSISSIWFSCMTGKRQLDLFNYLSQYQRIRLRFCSFQRSLQCVRAVISILGLERIPEVLFNMTPFPNHCYLLLRLISTHFSSSRCSSSLFISFQYQVFGL